MKLNKSSTVFHKKLKLLFLFTSLSACSITSLPSSVQHSIGQRNQDIDNANKKIDEAKNKSDKEEFITHTQIGYFGNHAITEDNTDFLPPIFNNQIQLDREFDELREFASTLTELTGIMTTADIGNPSTSTDYCSNIRITQQSGSLIDLLNQVAAKCDLAWDYREGKIVLADTETKTWPIKGIPGDIQVQSQIQNNSGAQAQTGSSGSLSTGGNAGGGGAPSSSQTQTQQSATQNTAYNLSNNLWKNLQDAIKMQLSKIGRMSISPSTSSLTVTDKPSVISNIDKYINNQNDKLKRMVIINVTLINVDVNAEDNYGINWNTILGSSTSPGQLSINGAVGSGAQSSSTPTNGGSSITQGFTQVFLPTNTTQAFTFGYNGGSGSAQFLINALSTNARSSIVTSTAVSTLSNQPVPLQFVDQQAYLASVANTAIVLGTSQVSLTPGQLTTGFSLNLLPVVESNHKVDLQISINLSALKQIAQYSSGGSSIQLPSTFQRNFMQKVVIRSGDTFVMTGFDSDIQNIVNTGVGSPTNWFFGGGVSATKKRTRMVMLVTPTIVTI